MKRTTTSSCGFAGLAGLLLLAVSTGCQSTYGGHMGGGPCRDEKGNIIYYQPGPEFKIVNEAAAAQANSPAEAAAQDTKR